MIKFLILSLTFLLFSCGDNFSREKMADNEIVSSNNSDSSVVCGNNVIESGEICDGTVKECKDIDSNLYLAGHAFCKNSCEGFDLSKCISDDDAICGDKVVEESEVCDSNQIDCVELDESKYVSGTAFCNENCIYEISECILISHNSCGNSMVDDLEVCDNNSVNCSEIDEKYASGTAICNSNCTDFNTSNCKLKPVCGNSQKEEGIMVPCI